MIRAGQGDGSVRGGGSRALFSALLLSLVLAACSTPRVPDGAVGLPPPIPVPDAGAPVEGIGPAALPGWDHEDHLAAFDAYVDGCDVARDLAARIQCERALQIRRVSKPVTPSAARAFFETGFVLAEVQTPEGRPGLLTAYFAPEYPARVTPDAEFDRPVLGRPADLVRQGTGVVQRSGDGTSRPYPDRATIEGSALSGRPAGPVLAWMRAEDLFFMQIQGSGYLTFPDGTRARAAYAADNGLPFVGIARPMADQGLLPRNQTSGDAIRAWLAAHRGPEASAVMALNPRYIFFATSPDDGGHPAGAAGIPLTARRAIAVDPAHWTYGDLVWIQADAGNLVGARAGYQGLVMALDTGSAIRGPVRADLYMGRGETAGSEAGAVRHPLRMWRLVPRG